MESAFAETDTLNQDSRCLLPNNIAPQPSFEDWTVIKDILTPMFNQCLQSTDYFALYGASLLYTGDTSKAIEMLERALLIDPQNGAANIDYAQALYQSGQILSAIQVNQALLEQHNIPPEVKTFLLQRKSEWEQQTSYWRNQLSFLYGHSNNLNNATYLDEIDRLIGFERAEPGHYRSSQLRSNHYKLTSEGASLFNVSINSRDSSLNASDTDELSVGYEIENESIYMRSNWNIEAAYVQLDNEGLYSSLESTLTLYPRNSASYFTIESRYLRFNGQRDNLDELSLTFKPGVSYSNGGSRIGLELGIGSNQSLDPNRPGGNRSRLEGSIFYNQALLGGHVAAKFSYVSTEDTRPYNPIYGFFDVRKTNYWTGTLQYLYSVNSNLILRSGYYYRDQDSNIDLFKTQTETYDIGLTFVF